ncbi:MAG: ATP-grasp domain-containing protein [Porticoccus sp.]|nr:ATP-grasp domain-containing protein [Porticoccus sp.]
MSKASHQEQSVLVLDGDTLPALSIIRSLGSKGVNLATASHLENPICSYSRYNQSSLSYSNPLESTDEFLKWVEKTLTDNQYYLIIPVTDRTLIHIARHFHDSPYAKKITMAGLDAIETVLDKAKTSLLAKQCGVPIPTSWDIRYSEDLDKLQHEFTYPIVVKPGRSISDKANRVPMTVRYAHSQKALYKISHELLNHTHLVLQQYFTGVGLGIELIADQGEIRYAFQHQRLHEMPLTGGGSSYRKSVDIDPELLEASKKLIKALNWHGVAMVEFKKNPETGDFILIEINGRFWGSLPLAVVAGADFPYMLYQLYTTGAVEEHSPYRRDIYCRKLSSDVRWLEAVIRKDADTRLVTIPTIKSGLKDLLHIFSPKHYFDAQSLKDIKPGLIDLKHIMATYGKRLFGQWREKQQRKRTLEQSQITKIEQPLKQAKHVLFLCYGNINRSAIAHIMADHTMPQLNSVEFKSAGFHVHGRRMADQRMAAIAEKHNLQTKNFRSTVLDESLVDWADIIFVMESQQLHQLEEQYSQAQGKTFLLGGLYQVKNAIEITDPYNKPTAIYEETFQKVDRCIVTMKHLLTTDTVS